MKWTGWIVLAVGLTACGAKDNPVAPTPTPAPVAPVIPSCEANHTAQVSFGNRSATTTQTIWWDGLTVATLAPGQDSVPFTTSSGVAHRLETRITNTNVLACAPSQPVPTQCGTHKYTCAFP